MPYIFKMKKQKQKHKHKKTSIFQVSVSSTQNIAVMQIFDAIRVERHSFKDQWPTSISSRME